MKSLYKSFHIFNDKDLKQRSSPYTESLSFLGDQGRQSGFLSFILFLLVKIILVLFDFSLDERLLCGFFLRIVILADRITLISYKEFL